MVRHRRTQPCCPRSCRGVHDILFGVSGPETSRPGRAVGSSDVLARAQRFPRLRYMGSKYRLLPHLERTFAEIGGTTAVDAFSGSGVVSYLLKAQGFEVVSNDFLHFPHIITRASVANSSVRLEPELIEQICGPAADDRDYISSTFDGLYFTAEDRAFLDSAWSHIDALRGYRRDLAISPSSCPLHASSRAGCSPSPTRRGTPTDAATSRCRCATISVCARRPTTTPPCSATDAATGASRATSSTSTSRGRRLRISSTSTLRTRRPPTTTTTSSATTSSRDSPRTGAA